MSQGDPGPELRLGDVPNLCSYGQRPRMMNGLFVQLLRQQFAAPGLIEEPALRGGPTPPVWRSDDRVSGLTIETATRWDPGQSGSRPAIVVRRDAWTPVKQGIGNSLMGPGTAEDGSDLYAIFIQGSHTLFAVGEDDEAEDIGTEVYRGMIQFGEVIRQHFQLHRFAVAEIGPPGRIKEASDVYGVPVTVAYAFEDVWRITPQSPFLKTITISSILRAG